MNDLDRCDVLLAMMRAEYEAEHTLHERTASMVIAANEYAGRLIKELAAERRISAERLAEEELLRAALVTEQEGRRLALEAVQQMAAENEVLREVVMRASGYLEAGSDAAQRRHWALGLREELGVTPAPTVLADLRAKVAAMEAVVNAAGEVVALANDGEPLADGILLLALALAGLHPVVIASSAGGE